jgi:hypothetical protein
MSEERYAPYARETAMCVDFAYNSFEEDITNELATATGETRIVLLRLLQTVTERRAVLERFTKKVDPKAA